LQWQCGGALVFGTVRRTSALDAALVNGTASHALDYDDFSSDLGGHQSVPLVAPLFALAEERGASGLRLVLAYVAGIEAMIPSPAPSTLSTTTGAGTRPRRSASSAPPRAARTCSGSILRAWQRRSRSRPPWRQG